MNRYRLLQIAGVVHDIIMSAVSFYAAYAAIVGYNTFLSTPGIHGKAVLFVIVCAASFYLSSLNRGSWRYASIHDLFAILRGSFFAIASFTIILFMVSRGDNMPRSVLLLTFVFIVFLLGGSRLIYRILKENGFFSRSARKNRKRNVRDVLLFGAGANAESFIRAIRRSEFSDIRVAGIIDKHQRQGLKIQGVEVLGGEDSIEQVLKKVARKDRKISEIVVTDFQLDRAKIGELVSMASQHGLEVTRIPNLSATAQFQSRRPATKPVEISDLLGRAEVEFDSRPVALLIEEKVVFITGGGGSVGSELARQIAAFKPKKLVITDMSDFFLYTLEQSLRNAYPELDIVTKIADIRDFARIDTLFRRFKPDVVFHAAALKQVPMLENNVMEAIKTNVFGSKNVADLSVAHNVRTFVQISTDKAVNPTSVMGLTKRAAEAYCQALDLNNETTRFKTVRFGNVLGSNGSVVPQFAAQIARGGPVTVTHEQITRFFMTISEAVRLVLQASAHGTDNDALRGRILVLNMGEPVKIIDLARRMIELAGYQPGVDIDIQITGLRPGEKLYEELFDSEEYGNVTSNGGYFAASSRIVSYFTIKTVLAELEHLLDKEDQQAALACLRKLVPEYRPQTGGDDNVFFLGNKVANNL